MEKQSKEVIRLATGWSGQEFLTNMERLVDMSRDSDCILAESELETIEKATNGSDSDSDELASMISIEEAQRFRTNSYMGFTPEKLHAIFEQYGHVRDIADILAGHGRCQQETLVGLYNLYHHDISFVETLMKRWQKLPENLLQRIYTEHKLEPSYQLKDTSTTVNPKKE